MPFNELSVYLSNSINQILPKICQAVRVVDRKSFRQNVFTLKQVNDGVSHHLNSGTAVACRLASVNAIYHWASNRATEQLVR